MTINGPAPMILAMFLNTAIDQQVDALPRARRAPSADEAADPGEHAPGGARHGPGRHPQGGPGAEHLHLLDRVRAEDDGRHPGVFHQSKVRNYYSACRSAVITSRRRGRTRSRSWRSRWPTVYLVEYYLSRGMAHRRLRAQPLLLLLQRPGPGVHRPGPRGAADLGGGDADLRRGRAQPEAEVPHPDLGPLSARQEIQFNDIRTTCRRCWRCGTTATACTPTPTTRPITTPTRESVRRAMAIQLIINARVRLNQEREPLAGLVRGARSSRSWSRRRCWPSLTASRERGGVLGAMETQYQRGKIQDESMVYELKKHSRASCRSSA
jgi:methylmalonyl-CoA mutase